MADRKDQGGGGEDFERTLAELDRRWRFRRPVVAALTFAPVVVIGAILLGVVTTLRDARRDLKIVQREVQDKQLAVSELRAAEAKLGAAIDAKKKELDALAQEKQEMAEYVARLRAALEPPRTGPPPESVPLQAVGNVPSLLRATIKPRAGVRARTMPDGDEVYDVDLSIEVPAGRESPVESVSYDLDARFYKNNHFTSDGTTPVKLTVLGCESKVLTTVKLRPPAGSLTIDFDWCKAPGWSEEKVPIRGSVPTIDVPEKGTPPPMPAAPSPPDRPFASPRF